MSAIAEEFPECATLALELADEEDVASVVLTPSHYGRVKFEAERAMGRKLNAGESFSIGGVLIKKAVVH